GDPAQALRSARIIFGVVKQTVALEIPNIKKSGLRTEGRRGPVRPAIERHQRSGNGGILCGVTDRLAPAIDLLHPLAPLGESAGEQMLAGHTVEHEKI